MASETVSWEKELKDLVATAKTEQEKTALEAFQKALGPYLDDPTLLRTLLGKIASRTGNELGVVISKGEFVSITELENALPANLKVVTV